MNDISALYEKDYYLWLQETYQRLEKKEIDLLDWPHLTEEILSLGNEQRQKVASYLRQLLIHLLLYQYWESERELCAKGWQNEIDNFRFELELLLKSQTFDHKNQICLEKLYPKRNKFKNNGLLIVLERPTLNITNQPLANQKNYGGEKL